MAEVFRAEGDVVNAAVRAVPYRDFHQLVFRRFLGWGGGGRQCTYCTGRVAVRGRGEVGAGRARTAR